MAGLTGKTIASTYHSILKVSTSDNQNLDTTLRDVVDGEDTASCLKLATDKATFTLGTDSGDDFIIGDGSSNLLVVEGDTKDVTILDDLILISDSSVIKMGAGADATFTHDGTTGLTIAATPISINSTGDLTLDSSTDIVLDAAGGNFEFKDAGTTQLTIDVDTTAGDININLNVDGDDLVFNRYDGTEVMRITDTARVGVGTAAPANLLHLAGADSAYKYISFTNDTTGHANTDGFVIGISDGEDAMLTQKHNQDMIFATNNITRMTIKDAGNVGIGTDSPDTNLHIVGNGGLVSGHEDVNVNSVLVLEEDAAHYAEFIGGRNSEVGLLFTTTTTDDDGFIAFHPGNSTPANAYLKFGLANDERMRIEGNGNVGIGVAAPAHLLHLHHATGASFIKIDSDTGDDAGIHLGVDDSTYWTIFNDATRSGGVANSLVFNDDGDERMCINQGTGHVGIGIVSPAYMLDVYGSAGSGYVGRFFNDGNAAGAHVLILTGGADDGSGLTYYATCQDGNGDNIGFLQHAADGDFEAVDASDIRLKENVVDTAVKGLESINAIKVRDFNWKDRGQAFKSAGLIANELREVFSPAVFGEPDAMEDILDDEGNKIGEKISPMTISKVKLVPVLIKAVQELSAKVTALENK